MHMEPSCRRTPCSTCWTTRAQTSSVRSPTTAPGRCANFQNLLDNFHGIFCVNRTITFVSTAGKPHVQRAVNPAVGVLQHRLGGAQTFNIHWNLNVLYFRKSRESKHVCPLQENPVFHVLETPRPNLDPPQWESYCGTWEVRKFSTSIKLLFYCYIAPIPVTCCTCNVYVCHFTAFAAFFCGLLLNSLTGFLGP